MARGYKMSNSNSSNCRNYYYSHKQAMLERVSKYYQEHKEERAKYNKKYYKTHKEEVKGSRIVYYKNHKRGIAKYRKERYPVHKEEILKRKRAYYKAHKKDKKEHLIKVIESAIRGEGVDMTHREFAEFLCRHVNEDDSDVVRDIIKKRK